MRAVWPFVGRRAELQLIGDAIKGGAGVVLAGASGVGKTRLAAEALAGVDPRRYRSLWVTAGSETGSVPLGALEPVLPAELTVSDDPAALLRSATEALVDRGGSRSLVLGIDDAHLLDELSATLVHHLVRTRKALVLSTVPSRRAVPDPIRALWKNGLAGRIEVEALCQSTVTDVLVAALDGQVDTATVRLLWRTVRGNMKLLKTLVEAGVDSGALTEVEDVWRWEGPWVLTPRLVAAVCERIEDLPVEEQDVLEILAFGEPIGADLLTTLTRPGAVEAVEARNLLSVQQDGRRVDIRLDQPLYGAVLRAGCPPQRAERWRRLLADAVARTGARRPGDRMRVATWRLDASLPVATGELASAAHEAFAALDLPLAERLARAVLATGDPEQDGEPVLVALAVLWRVLLLAQRSAEAEEELSAWARLPMPDEHRVDLAVGRAYHLFFGLADVEQAFAVLAAAREAVTTPTWCAELDLLSCLFQVLLGAAGDGLSGLAALAGRPELGARPAAQLPAVRGAALLHVGRLAAARESLDLAHDSLGRWADQVPWMVEMRSLCRCHAALFAGRLVEAAHLAAAFHDHTTERGWEFALRLSCGVRAQVARLRGQVHTAARWAREGVRVHASLPAAPFRHHVQGELAHALALAGNLAAARKALQEADRDPARCEPFLRPWVELARPWVVSAAGDRERAAELAVAAARGARDREAPVLEAFGLHDALRLGAPATVVDRMQELAGVVDGDLVRTFAEHATAVVRDDAAGLEAVAGAFAEVGASLLAAEACAQAAYAHGRRGEPAAERWQRTRAALLLDNCEGARTPLVAGIEAPALTPRERDVASLAATGLSNQDIADRLILSRRTVANHLHHVYAKLGVADRASLAALVPALRPQP